ncbi:5537_t:CDS:2 [Acaulospora colombiana]|uniref:5537_t:CDS:1 n=1 Tax=Acaulospora colombiana TaxID=27376 RepID=A0ACA9KHU6_9GLOM|nr:5537_t:CDS:2 [Acaulospora colombiana]
MKEREAIGGSMNSGTVLMARVQMDNEQSQYTITHNPEGQSDHNSAGSLEKDHANTFELVFAQDRFFSSQKSPKDFLDDHTRNPSRVGFGGQTEIENLPPLTGNP